MKHGAGMPIGSAYVTAKGKALDSAEGSKLYVDKLKELRDQYGTTPCAATLIG